MLTVLNKKTESFKSLRISKLSMPSLDSRSAWLNKKRQILSIRWSIYVPGLHSPMHAMFQSDFICEYLSLSAMNKYEFNFAQCFRCYECVNAILMRRIYAIIHVWYTRIVYTTWYEGISKIRRAKPFGVFLELLELNGNDMVMHVKLVKCGMHRETRIFIYKGSEQKNRLSTHSTCPLVLTSCSTRDWRFIPLCGQMRCQMWHSATLTVTFHQLTPEVID